MDSDYDERLSEGSNSLNDDQINNTIETTAKSMEEELPAILMEDNVEDAQMSTEEECPKILQPAFSDIFPLFANMLDIKSFMRLALASKEMYTKCMDDKKIKLNVKEKGFNVRMINGAPQLDFSYFGRRNVNSYLANLRRLKFDISLSHFGFNYTSFDSQDVIATRNYLREIGVKSIDQIDFRSDFRGWQEIVPFMEEFNVKYISTRCTIPGETLSSMLQLNMHSFDYFGSVSAATLLNVSSPIPKMEFFGMEEMSNDEFTQILWKIQTGPLENLTLKWSAVDMSSFDALPFEYDDALPDERPLVFSSVCHELRSYWFLHWHGGVTKCVGEGFEDEYYIRLNRYKGREYDEEAEATINITKCDPSDYPPVIRPKELVFKELEEKRDRVVCSSANFHSYFEGKDMLDPSSTIPLPEERPLLCKGARESYWSFKEDGILEQFQWDNAKVHYHAFDTNSSDYPSECDNIALANYFFQRRLKESVDGDIKCSKEQFNSWLKEYKTLPYDYHGPLPEDRPLIFSKSDEPDRHRAILLEGGTVTSCSFRSYSSECHLTRFVPWELPSCLISVKELKEILLKAPSLCHFARLHYIQLSSELKYSLGLEKLRAGFQDFKTLSWKHDGPLPDDRPLVFIKVEENGDEVSEQRWVLKECLVMECEWKNGEVVIREGDPKNFPLALTKGLVKEFMQGKWKNFDTDKEPKTFFIDFATFRGSLEDFKTLPHAHSGPLPEDRPLIFEKPAIKHECNKPLLDNCNCIDFWSLCAGDIIVCGSWSEKGEQKITFSRIVNGNDVPPVLKTKDYLKYLMEYRLKNWYGERRDFLAYFGRMRQISNRPNSKIRLDSGTHKRYLLREDETSIHCHWTGSSLGISVSPKDDLPL